MNRKKLCRFFTTVDDYNEWLKEMQSDSIDVDVIDIVPATNNTFPSRIFVIYVLSDKVTEKFGSHEDQNQYREIL